jgi:hypothetical protein
MIWQWLAFVKKRNIWIFRLRCVVKIFRIAVEMIAKIAMNLTSCSDGIAFELVVLRELSSTALTKTRKPISEERIR